MARDTTINVSGTVKRTDGRFVATVAVVQYGLLSSVTGEASTVAMAVKRAIDVGSRASGSRTPSSGGRSGRPEGGWW